MKDTIEQAAPAATADEAALYRWGYRVGGEDFTAGNPPVAPFEEGTASYSGYFRGYHDQAKEVLAQLERARQATAKTADRVECVDGEWVRQTVDKPANFIEVPEPLADKVADRMAALREERQDVSGHRRAGQPLADQVAEQVAGLADEHGWETVAEAAKQLAADEMA